MLVVDMGIYPEQSLQDCFDDCLEVGRKPDADFARKKCFIIELILNPGHQIVDVFWRRALDGLFHRLPIGPMVFVFRARRHNGTALLGAKLGDGAVEHVDLVKEVYCVDGDPFVDVFAFRKLNSQS